MARLLRCWHKKWSQHCMIIQNIWTKYGSWLNILCLSGCNAVIIMCVEWTRIPCLWPTRCSGRWRLGMTWVCSTEHLHQPDLSSTTYSKQLALSPNPSYFHLLWTCCTTFNKPFKNPEQTESLQQIQYIVMTDVTGRSNQFLQRKNIKLCDKHQPHNDRRHKHRL